MNDRKEPLPSHNRAREREFLTGNRLETRGQLKTQKMTECKSDRTLTMVIDILPLDFHVGAVSQDPLDHGRHLGGGAPLKLGVDAGRLTPDMRIDHDTPSTIAGMPFGHQITIPCTKLGGTRSAWRACVAPHRRITNGQRGVRDTGSWGPA